MTNSILEITENEYLIKLNRRNFDLSFIRSLLKLVEVAKPADEEEEDTLIRSRNIDISQTRPAEAGYFSFIEEK